MWDEARVPRENPCEHEENMQIPQRTVPAGNIKPPCCPEIKSRLNASNHITICNSCFQFNFILTAPFFNYQAFLSSLLLSFNFWKWASNSWVFCLKYLPKPWTLLLLHLLTLLCVTSVDLYGLKTTATRQKCLYRKSFLYIAVHVQT